VPTSGIRVIRPGLQPALHHFGENNSIALLVLPRSRKNSSESHSDWVYRSTERRLSAADLAWLQAQIAASRAAFTIVASDIQIQADHRLNVHMSADSKDAILSANNSRTRILLLSGDEHYGEVLADPCSLHLHGYPLKEFTSTGLSHKRQKPVYRAFGSLYYMAWNYFAPGYYNRKRDRTTERNIGSLDLDLDEGPESRISFQLFDRRGRTVVKERIGRPHFE